MIETSSFGLLVINGKTYNSDLVIYPDGHIVDAWYRKKCHGLSSDDINQLIESEPDIIIAGTGVSGMVKPEQGLEEQLQQKGIEFISAPNQKAIEIYNELSSKRRVGACFHLTC